MVICTLLVLLWVVNGELDMRTYDSVMTPSDDGHWVLKSEADSEIRHHTFYKEASDEKI